jgi:hypothetical protein
MSTTGNLSVRIWSISLGEYVDIAGLTEPRDSLADAVRRARYYWALIHRDWSTTSNVPRADHPDMRGGFSILIDGTDERGFDYTAFSWTPDRELPYWA